MPSATRSLPLAKLDRFWARQLGCEPHHLRSARVELVSCGQQQIQILATPDGTAVIGWLPFIEVEKASLEQLLSPQFWATQFNLPLYSLTFYGPSSLAYVHKQTFNPQKDDAIRELRRHDAAELARFARILQAREPDIFHSWAIGGRVTANQRLWGAFTNGKIVSVAGLRPVNKAFYEVGINTLPRHRNRGWGTAVASVATQAALKLGPLVQWSTPLNNEPSQRIAKRLGYVHYAHQLWLSAPRRGKAGNGREGNEKRGKRTL